MSVLHFVDRPHDLVVTSFSERVTLDQIAVACTKLRHDHDFHPRYRQLADLSKVSLLDLCQADLTAIRVTYDPFSKESRRAFVVPDEDTFGKVRSYQSILESKEFGLFSSLLDAISWLDLDVAVLPSVCATPSFREAEEASPLWTFDLPDSTPRTFRRTFRPAKAHRRGH